MKLIYDSEQPKNRRITFIGDADKTPYFGYQCFQILLDDGREVVKIARWGNAKARQKILDALKEEVV